MIMLRDFTTTLIWSISAALCTHPITPERLMKRAASERIAVVPLSARFTTKAFVSRGLPKQFW